VDVRERTRERANEVRRTHKANAIHNTRFASLANRNVSFGIRTSLANRERGSKIHKAKRIRQSGESQHVVRKTHKAKAIGRSGESQTMFGKTQGESNKVWKTHKAKVIRHGGESQARFGITQGKRFASLANRERDNQCEVWCR
jgi:hypothetical protein